MNNTTLKYLAAYSPVIQQQAQQLLEKQQLKHFLRTKYPSNHNINNDKKLRAYVNDLKNQYLRKSSPLSKVVFDQKIHVINNSLGQHKFISRVQGNKLKSKNEIHISSLFKQCPEAFLNMIVVHELAHLKEKQHNKAFYQLCVHMQADYHQLELDMRLYLIELEYNGAVF